MRCRWCLRMESSLWITCPRLGCPMVSTHLCLREKTCKLCKNFRSPWNSSKKQIIWRKHSRCRNNNKSKSRWATFASTCNRLISIRPVWRLQIHTAICPWSWATSSSIYLSSRYRHSWAADLKRDSKAMIKVPWTAVMMKNLSCHWSKLRVIKESLTGNRNRTRSSITRTREVPPPSTHLRERKPMTKLSFLRRERRRVTRLSA